MEFLSELEKKITDAGKDIARKVKDISEVSRLYTVIAGEQKNITDNYIKLGKEYYTQHADESAQGELTHYCELIRVSLETIEQCRKQIAVLKGQQICDSCGAQVSLDSVFCPKCGAKMPEQPVEEPEEEIEVTTEEPEEEALANEDTEEGAACECEACGCAQEEAPAEADEDIPQADESESPLFCKLCGSELPESAVFCPKCGRKLD